jgi:hypothetical protein
LTEFPELIVGVIPINFPKFEMDGVEAVIFYKTVSLSLKSLFNPKLI